MSPAQDGKADMARILITSAIPYINGIKHLGNLVGSQLPADLYARFCRAMGHEVMFICATDEHGTPAELAAAKAGKPVEAYCAEMHKGTAQHGRFSGCRSIISVALPVSATTS